MSWSPAVYIEYTWATLSYGLNKISITYKKKDISPSCLGATLYSSCCTNVKTASAGTYTSTSIKNFGGSSVLSTIYEALPLRLLGMTSWCFWWLHLGKQVLNNFYHISKVWLIENCVGVGLCEDASCFIQWFYWLSIPFPHNVSLILEITMMRLR